MNALQLAPGWYTDPTAPAFVRFWNGSAWLAHRKPRPGLPAVVQQRKQRSFFSTNRRIA